MPLSDREQQILQDIERGLFEEDPKFARGVTTASVNSTASRNAKRGIAVFALGFLLLIAFFLSVQIAVGVVAFLIMVVGATYTYQNLRKMGGEENASTKTPSGQGLLGRVEGRMRGLRRRDGSD